MKFEYLISQFDKHNEIDLLLCKKFNIKKLVYLVEDKKDINFDEYKELIPECEINYHNISKGNINEIKNILLSYPEAIVNITVGEKINSLILLSLCSELKICCLFADLLNKKRYVFYENCRVIEKPLEDLSIEEIINLSGSKIINECSSLADKSELIDICRIILNNLSLWNKYKQRLYNPEIFIHDYKDSYKVKINQSKLENEEKILLDKCLKYLEKINGIDCKKEGSVIEVEFKNDYLKSFLFKSGTWLEVITHFVMGKIGLIDETKSGVLFSWNRECSNIRNEIDVISVRDSVLVCISCKDSQKYDEESLNELEIYSEKIGGDEVIKILVATKVPIKKTVLDRAKEMNINIVIIDNDIDKFKNKILDIIKEG